MEQLKTEGWQFFGLSGKYEDYAANPWKYSKEVVDKVHAGTYEHFYPRNSK